MQQPHVDLEHGQTRNQTEEDRDTLTAKSVL